MVSLSSKTVMLDYLYKVPDGLLITIFNALLSSIYIINYL